MYFSTVHIGKQSHHVCNHYSYTIQCYIILRALLFDITQIVFHTAQEKSLKNKFKKV